MDRVSHSSPLLPRWLDWFFSAFGSCFYRVRARGQAQVPAQGAAILLANHLSRVDPVLIRRACPRPIRFFGYTEAPDERWRRALAAGEVLCLFPEGEISRLGQMQSFRPGIVALARTAGVPVVPVGHDGIWGSIFSYSWRKYLWKRPRFRPIAISVCFGPALPAEQLSLAGVRAALLERTAEAFADRPFLRGHLGRKIARALARSPGRPAVIDWTAERRVLSAARLFAVSAVLAQWLRREIPARRVGVVLPPGAGATIANLALVWAGKIPVNLNFTAGASTLKVSFELAEIDTVITAEAMRAKLPDFPWPKNIIDLHQTITALGKDKIVKWLALVWLLPGWALAALLRQPKVGDREEAALLFTSGSAGAPKGVSLTHRNLLANCSQITSTNVLPEAATLLGCLPIFHSFGFTITIWYALIRRMKLVTIPSPLDTKKMVDVIREEAITVVVGAPTFLRPLLKKAQPSDLRSLELLVSGAEKMPLELHRAFLGTLQIDLIQGYGLTETAPVTNINQHDRPAVGGGPAGAQTGQRLGSVGRLLPGMAARIVNPNTGESQPLTETGLLLFRGENVFGGYLKDPEKSRLALRDGWFVTGDLARFDEDGFLFIEGRLSRFSKIGGEMVPHGTIEQKLIEVFGWDERESPVVVVVGLPDASKGERLVLLTTEDLLAETIRQALSEAGLPNLWIPRVVFRVEKIPLLGPGKVDLQTCRQLAEG